jgi:hypothetical protein
MADEILNVKEWLTSNGISERWAQSVMAQVKKEYPYLGKALKERPGNRAQLEVAQLVDHVLKGRFPVPQKH